MVRSSPSNTARLFGALDPRLQLPELVYHLGLVLFVYTLGLANGTTFFASLRGRGLRDSFFVAAILCAGAALVAAVARALGMSPALAAGLFAGSLTNTPALAAILESLKHTADPGTAAAPVVAYSVAYPMGVVGMLLGIVVFQRLFRIDYRREAARVLAPGAGKGRLSTRTIEVLRFGDGRALRETIRNQAWDAVFGRLKRDGVLTLMTGDEILQKGDLVAAIGPPAELDRVEAYLGAPSNDHLDLDRAEMDSRFVVVSSRAVVGRPLRDLSLPERFGALVTRVRRGDVELVPHGDTVLELGDQARILTRRRDLDAVGAFFGDSYRALRELDALTFSLGLGLGLLLGTFAVPLPYGLSFRLGLAGGPLLVALVLGAVGRTGRMVWTLPHSANQTLRQVGLILFLAGVGTRAGDAFFATARQAEGLVLLAAGAGITLFVAGATLWIGYRILKMPMGLLTGVLAAIQTQPAVLAFAQEQSDDDLPSVGYAHVYPVAIFLKIVLAQLLLALL
jgi:putative transport protein